MDRFLIVVLNGPAHCGKDTIASKLQYDTVPFAILNHRHVRCWQEKMIAPLRDALCEMFHLSSYTFEMKKDEPILPNGVTPRQALIEMDKLWARPLFGEGFLGNVLVEELEAAARKKKQYYPDNPVHIHLVDAGVEAEFQVLKQAYGEKVKVIHIYRDGYSFYDTRGYLTQCDGIVYNNGGIVKTIEEILSLISGWLEEIYDKVDAGTTSGVLEKG